MDTLDIRELLNTTFGDAFDFHPDFIPEFQSLIQESGSQSKIITQFIRRLDAIKKLGDVDYGPNWIEHLKKYGNMYSLHIDADRKNYRLLFSKNEKGKYFLHTFYERSGKKSSSYATHVPIAIRRRDGSQ